MRKIFYKIFGGYLLVVTLLISIILFLSYRTIKDYYIDALADDLASINHSLILNFKPFLMGRSNMDLDSLVKSLGEKTDSRITVIDKNGTVLGDSQNDPEKMENHAKRPEISSAMNMKVGVKLRYSTTVKEDMLYVAMPIESEGNVLGVSRISFYLSDIELLIRDLVYKIAQISILMLILSVTGILILSRSISKPINQLARAARRVASGDFDVKVFLKNKDELNDLGESFNYMIEQIKNLFEEVSLKKEELNSIISSIRDSLLVLDEQGKILLFNQGFVDIIKDQNPEDRYYWEVLRSEYFGQMFNNIVDRKIGFSVEIELNYRYYLSSFNWIEAKDEVVVILYDITDIKKLELVKKDFVNNVSHELRTPLTAIKGFIETLEYDAEDEKRHYLQIMLRHTNRLINIVKDLLELSNLEESKVDLELTKVDLNDLVPYVTKIFEENITKKGLYLKFNIDDGVEKIEADRFKLEQIFINLIDNAIKYTDEGGIDINIKKNEESINIIIKDTGLGIPKDKIDRIFERFYIVDKSRSRKVGGTGLGLSIVKHIVMLHNGLISIDSAVGIGTTFKLTLPIKQATGKVKSNKEERS